MIAKGLGNVCVGPYSSNIYSGAAAILNQNYCAVMEECATTDSLCNQRNAMRVASLNARALDMGVLSNIATPPASDYKSYPLVVPVDVTPETIEAQYKVNIAAVPSQPTQQAATVTNTSGVHNTMLTFTPSRSGGILYPGDTWTISITGATPNASVTVKGGVGGQQIVTTMGATDGSGNFSLSGTISADEVGIWNEAWSVAGILIGSFMFTVATPTPFFYTSQPGNSVPASGDQTTTYRDSATTDGTTDGIVNWIEQTFSIGGINIPYWAVGAAGIGLVLMFGMRR